MEISSAIAFMMYGYDAGVLGGLQGTDPFLFAMGYPTGTWIIPMISSAYVLGATVMSLAVPLFGVQLGRKRAILIGDILVVIGGALQASAWSVPQIIVARLICGFGVGLISCTVPTYISEMSIKHTERGPDVAIQCVYLINGVALGLWIDYATTSIESQFSWRFPIALQSLFALLSGCGVALLPDTPRWYYLKGRTAEGDQGLSDLHNLPLEHPDVQHVKREILESLELERNQPRFRLISLIWDNSELKAGRRIRIGYLVLAMQQLMGINLLVYYSTLIMAQLDLAPRLVQLLAAVINTAFAMGTWFLPSTIERFGRRSIMMYSAMALTVFMAIFVAMIGLPDDKKTPATQWTAVGAVLCFELIMGYGWIGVPWLYGPEIAPLRYRHVGGAAGAFGEWSMTFVTVFAGGIALQNVGWKIWIWQLVSCVVTVIFVYYMCPEVSPIPTSFKISHNN